MTRRPPSVSSNTDKKYPCSFWTLSDFFFKDFPTSEIRYPDIGIKINTNNVSCGLKASMAMIVKIIVNGSLTINSKIDKNEC